MTILAVTSSAATASAALLRDGRLILEQNADPAKKHAETLVPLLQELLAASGMPIEEVDAFAVDIGPGSFTGIRIGVCVVNALAFARQKPVIAVDSLRALAEPHWETANSICVLIDAGHDASYTALYENGACAMPPCMKETEALLASLSPDTLVLRDRMPRAAHLAMAAWRLRDAGVSAVAPLYVQPSQAERLHKARGGKAHD
jgi:tRNA threonylcarbamoyl adenosine modification protein YeaZ